jgi:hypothetical protein
MNEDLDMEKFRLPQDEVDRLLDDAAAASKHGSNTPSWLVEKISADKTGSIAKKPRRNQEWFIQVFVKAVIAGAKAARDRRWVVWIYVHYRVGLRNSNTVEIGTKTLREWGVSHQTKLRALRFYEQAGLWSVEWRKGQCPLVTVRPDLCKLRAR